ncbi:MAG: leucine-rich repeat domain-containing protein [Spirochaetaceae bacterium]|jgi:hypothetical protein|nr:leucine-rich repeat domain-containing protein [Spirochaetaceae bacterium]
MRKLCLALFFCISFLAFVFGEDLASGFLARNKEFSEQREETVVPNAQDSGWVLPQDMDAEQLAGLGRQSVELSNNSRIKVIEDWAFAYTDLTAVNIPEGVTVIGKGAFANNALSSVLLPFSLQTIDEWAFAHNNISAVVFPENVALVGEYAFWDNGITDVTLGDFVHLSREAIDNGFFEVYNKEQKVAGHYIKKDGIWLRESRE